MSTLTLLSALGRSAKKSPLTELLSTPRESDVAAGAEKELLEEAVNVASGIVKFSSLEDMEGYVKALCESYQKECDALSEVVATMYRGELDRRADGVASMAWQKVGSLFVNMADPDMGMIEVALQLYSEMKPRLAKTSEVLEKFNLMGELSVPADARFLLYVRNGVPERILVERPGGESEKFNFSATYLTT
jgi:hypothetical protein